MSASRPAIREVRLSRLTWLLRTKHSGLAAIEVKMDAEVRCRVYLASL
jgi:hypothetical protein